MTLRQLRRILTPVLFPISLVYGIAVGLRNRLFNAGILKSVEFEFPVITVGNITVGGTGKTPHVEYLIELLSANFEVAMLSRGYKRKTKGFLMADENSFPEDIGDEPCQVQQKFKNVVVAVDEDRVRGIRLIKEKRKETQVVILDDAFQHRYVKPGLAIVLIDYNRPVFKDNLLPLGDLREKIKAIDRANIVIVTKSPLTIKPIERRIWSNELDLFPYQSLYFTFFNYGDLVPVYNKKSANIPLSTLKNASYSILLVTGIANPDPLIGDLKQYTQNLTFIRYPDHYEYSMANMIEIADNFNAIRSEKKIVITTEKDSVKLIRLETADKALKDNFFYLPVAVVFHENRKEEFDKNIISFINRKKN